MTREMNKPDWHNNWVYRERTDNGTFMKEYFNGQCQGSIEYLSGTNLEELCRNTRYGLNRRR